jgi:hypothetical protein
MGQGRQFETGNGRDPGWLLHSTLLGDLSPDRPSDASRCLGQRNRPRVSCCQSVTQPKQLGKLSHHDKRSTTERIVKITLIFKRHAGIVGGTPPDCDSENSVNSLYSTQDFAFFEYGGCQSLREGCAQPWQENS